MTSKEINQKNYDIWSDFYDDYPNPTVAIDDLNFPSFYKHWEGFNILEIGCGTGRHTARLFQQGNTIVGLDLSTGMLSKAKEKIPNGDFINADFLTHDFRDRTFDKIILSLVLEHIADLKTFFQKVSTLLNDQGEILISEIHPTRAKAGSLAHFKQGENEELWLSSKAHEEEEILKTSHKANLKLVSQTTIKGSKELENMNSKWSKYLDLPMIQIWCLQKVKK